MPNGTPTSAAAVADALPASRATEMILVDQRTVACDGGDGALGHPRIFLHMAGTEVICPYCSRLYVLNEGAGGDSGH